MLGFIVNPASGFGRGLTLWNQVQRELRNRGVNYAYRITKQRGETTRLTQDLLNEHNIDTLIAIGGDGTTYEVANGLYQSGQLHNVRFGHIPGGTGNDYARSHGISSDPIQILNFILNSQDGTKLDLLEVDGTIALNCIGVGFDAVVAKYTNEATYKKALNNFKLGKVSYFISAIKAFATFRPYSADIIVDGQEYHFSSVWMIVNSNVPYFGGAMKVCPHAVSDDGEVDVTVFHCNNRMKLISIFRSIYSGTHIHHPAVTILRGKHIELKPDSPQQAQADGEALVNSNFKIRVLKQALSIIK